MGYAVTYLSELLGRCSPKLRQHIIDQAIHFGLIARPDSVDEILHHDISELLAPLLSTGISEIFVVASLLTYVNEQATVPLGQDPSSEYLRKMELKLEEMYALRSRLDPSETALINGRISFYEKRMLPTIHDAVDITNRRRDEWKAVVGDSLKSTLNGVIRDINIAIRDHKGLGEQ